METQTPVTKFKFLDSPNLSFAEYIKFWREEIKKINQQELGKAASTSGAYICMIEKGVKLPSAKLCFKLAEALERPPQEVLEWMRKDKERRLFQAAESSKQVQATPDIESEDINSFIEAYRKLSPENKIAANSMVAGATAVLRRMEGSTQ